MIDNDIIETLESAYGKVFKQNNFSSFILTACYFCFTHPEKLSKDDLQKIRNYLIKLENNAFENTKSIKETNLETYV